MSAQLIVRMTVNLSDRKYLTETKMNFHPLRGLFELAFEFTIDTIRYNEYALHSEKFI